MDRSSVPGPFPGLPPNARALAQAQLDIRSAGEELLGERWQRPLAYMLGLNHRTVQRWASKQDMPPHAIVARIGELLAIARQSRSDAAADRDRRAREAAIR